MAQYVLWIKDSPSSPRSKRFPGCAPTQERWWTVLYPHANGGLHLFDSVEAASAEGGDMMRDYLAWAVEPYDKAADMSDRSPYWYGKSPVAPVAQGEC